jgi:hypothetical protein
MKPEFSSKAILFLSLLFVACDMKPVVERKFGKEEKPQRETSVLQAADLTGHDGTKLRRKAEALIEANQNRNRVIDKAIDETR